MSHDERLLTRYLTFDATAFTLGSAAHLGVRLSLGPIHLSDPRLLAPMLVDATCVLGFVIALVGMGGKRSWRLTAALGAHLIGTAGVALAILALLTGAAPRSGTTDIVHPLLILPLGAGFKLIARLREAAGEREREVSVPPPVHRPTPEERPPNRGFRDVAL